MPAADFVAPPCPQPELLLRTTPEVLDDRLVDVPDSGLRVGEFATGHDVESYNGAIQRCAGLATGLWSGSGQGQIWNRYGRVRCCWAELRRVVIRAEWA